MEKQPLKPEQTMEAVGARLALLREALELKQNKIVEPIGLTPPQWANYEKGIRMPNVQDMIRVADRYGATLDYIYRGVLAGMPHELVTGITKVQHEMMEPRQRAAKAPGRKKAA